MHVRVWVSWILYRCSLFQNTGRNFNALKTVYVKGKSLGGICWVGVEPGTGLGGQFKLL